MKAFNKLWTAGLVCTLLIATACQKSKESSNGSTPVQPPINKTENQGGVDGGGGDLPQSTEKEVTDAIDSSFKRLTDLFYNLAMSRGSIDDPYVLRVMDHFYNKDVGQDGWEDSQPIYSDLKNTQLDIKKTGGCFEQSKKSHTMGVDHFELGQKICVSVEQLRVLPPEELPLNLTALFVHELTHHFGFGEIDATKMQNYVLHNFQQLSSFSDPTIVELKKFTLRIEADTYSYKAFHFQNGELVEKVDSEKDACDLYISAADDVCEDVVKNHKAVEFQVKNLSLHLTSIAESAGGTFGGPFSVTAINFAVNKAWDGLTWQDLGAPLQRTDGKDTKARISAVNCYGPNLRYQDILKAFQGAQL